MIIKKIKSKDNLIKNKIRKGNFCLFSQLSFKGKCCFFLVLLVTLYTIFGPSIREEKVISTGIESYLIYFTNQTILTVFIILISFFFNIPFKYRKIYFIFNFLVLVNSLLTSIFYNTILNPLWEKEILKDKFFLHKTVFQHLYVTFFGFPLFFFFFVPFSINLKKKREVFYTFLHPIIFLSIYYVIMLFFDCKKKIVWWVCGKPKICYLPYYIVQCPNHFKLSFLSEELTKTIQDILTPKITVLITLIVFFVIFSFLFICVFYLKNKFNEKILFNKISSNDFLNYIKFKQINNKNEKIIKNKKTQVKKK